MLSSRAILRAQRAASLRKAGVRPNIRFASTEAKTGGASGAVFGGLVGGGVTVALTYGYYHFSGAKTAVNSAKQAKSYIDSVTDQFKVKFQEKTPDDGNEAIKTLRDAANKYASFVPGGKQYVDSAFNDLEAVRQKHGQEVDGIVREAYGELRDASKKGMSLETANDTWNILSKHLQRLGALAGDAADQIMENHPQLKEKLGGSTDQLKQLGEKYGPEAKKQVDETWQEINKVLQDGMSMDAVNRIRKLVQEKSEQIKKMGEQAFNQGFEQIKPMLEKNPKVKEFVESNMETLKQGNVMETVQKVKSAVSSGDTKELESYLNQVKDKAQQYSSGQLSSWLGMIPGGSQILPQLQKIQEVAQKHGAEAEDLAKETINEIKQVLEKKSQRAEELVESGKQDAKK